MVNGSLLLSTDRNALFAPITPAETRETSGFCRKLLAKWGQSGLNHVASSNFPISVRRRAGASFTPSL